jgi:hypothetical protein
MVTAAQEFYGQSFSAIFSADTRLRLPYGQGGARNGIYTATTTGKKLILPKALSYLRGKVGAPLYVIGNVGANTFSVADRSGNVVTAVTTGQVAQVGLLDDSTDDGRWFSIVTSGALGSTVALDRQPWNVIIAEQGTRPIVLRDILDVRGYDGTSKVALFCEIQRIRGSDSLSLPAIDSGSFPSGSHLLLMVRIRLTGRGGGGGDGGAVPLGFGSSGEAGGPALTLRLDTGLVNEGVIAGGGGGGGGGDASPAVAGGGGGIGAGLLVGQPGKAGAGGGGREGSTGAGIGVATAGGVVAGAGDGGAGALEGVAGTAGSGGHSTGGAAGKSILKKTGITLTKIRAGTITGSEAFF